MKPAPDEVSPSTMLAEEMIFLRKMLRETLERYSARLDGNLVQVRDSVIELDKVKKMPVTRIHDLRDMLSLVRMLEIKPEKGRRRDLKRIESLIDELQNFTQNW